MSSNIQQIFTNHPITTNTSTDLMYFGQSPYTGANNNVAMTFSNFSAQFGVIGTPLLANEAVVTDNNAKLTSLVYTPVNVVSTIVSRDSSGNSAFNDLSLSGGSVAAGYVSTQKNLIYNTTVTNTNTATITAAQLFGGIIAPNSPGGNWTWTFDTGTNIYNQFTTSWAIGTLPTGSTIEVLFINNSPTLTATLASNTNVTLALASTTISPNSTKLVRMQVVGLNQINVYG